MGKLWAELVLKLCFSSRCYVPSSMTGEIIDNVISSLHVHCGGKFPWLSRMLPSDISTCMYVLCRRNYSKVVKGIAFSVQICRFKFKHCLFIVSWPWVSYFFTLSLSLVKNKNNIYIIVVFVKIRWDNIKITWNSA